jgi:GAF domain-containing protein
LEDIVGITASIVRAPFASVNFADGDNILVKASAGIGIEGVNEIKRDIGLCSFAVLQDEAAVFENARHKQHLAANLLVHGDSGLQFYAGAPLRIPDGFTLEY